MTRKDTRNTSALRGIAPFIAVLTVMIALAALAQTRGAGQASAKASVALATSNSGAPPRESKHPLPSEQNNGRHMTASREERKRLTVFSNVQNSPLFLPVVNYLSVGFTSSVAGRRRQWRREARPSGR